MRQANNKYKIVLYGPPIGKNIRKGSGGGVGGYTRNMQAYLHSLDLVGFQLRPLFHTVRGQFSLGPLTPVWRMIVDATKLLWTLTFQRPQGIHILAQYRDALPREALAAFLCKLFGVRLIYDVKAGSFETSFQNRGRMYKWMATFVLKQASVILVEGSRYQNFISEKFGRKSTYFPNFVPSSELPPERTNLLSEATIRVLFVGYCYPGKGVWELVEGVRKAALDGLKVELTLIGAESYDFSAKVDQLPEISGFRLIRCGRLAHQDVLAHMRHNDIYGYPTRHPGEGHSNSVNEAMMNGLVIVASRRGFLPDILEEDKEALFLEQITPESVAERLNWIHSHRDVARNIAAEARKKLLRTYTSSAVQAVLEGAYLECFKSNRKAKASP